MDNPGEPSWTVLGNRNLVSWVHEVQIPLQEGRGSRRHVPPQEALWQNRGQSASYSFFTASNQQNRSGQDDQFTWPKSGQTWPDNLPVQPQNSKHETGRVDPFAERRANLRNHLARARRWQQLISSGKAENAADIAAMENLSRARVSQVTKLLNLIPEILEEIDDPNRSGPIPTERQLRVIAKVGSTDRQLTQFARLVKNAHDSLENVPEVFRHKRTRQKGLQHLFERARILKRLFDSGRYTRLKELADEVGLSAERIGQLLNLNDIAPDLQEKLDVPFANLPEGFTSAHLRRLAAQRDHGAQRKLFKDLVKEAGGSSKR